MNRIVLIGNGFDLAHGLPTRYEDFLNWYWNQWGKKLRESSKKIEEDELCSFVLKDDIGLSGWYLVWTSRVPYFRNHSIDRALTDYAINNNDICEFKVKSVLFSRILGTIESKGWVDIEREYYDLLCNLSLNPEQGEYGIPDLNKDLHIIQLLLIEYLSSFANEDIKIDTRVREQIYGHIRKNDISISSLSVFYEYIKYLINQADNDYQRLLLKYDFKYDKISWMTNQIKRLASYPDITWIDDCVLRNLIIPENILLLNFNYTQVADKYGNIKISTVNHIHGKLHDINSVIFGYGDELDDNYHEFLKQEDNEYLKNIKSIRYLESPNYRGMLQFIDSAPYQVYIMGHSCGNSDRTLLNTLFEHKNCVSIKPFYYQKEDGSDNYIEIVQNICRNFTDMKLMRDRVVNKTFCEPLPQTNNHVTTD